jgi:host factor-I protein
MNSAFDRRAPSLDTTQPGIRQIQDWIRHATPVRLMLNNGHELEGQLRWQDLRYLALVAGESQPLTLLNRESVALIRPLL